MGHLCFAMATHGSILQGRTFQGKPKCLLPWNQSRSFDALLFVERCPSFLSSVVCVSRDHSVVGAQRPRVRVRAVVELRQDPLDRKYFRLMIWIKLIWFFTLIMNINFRHTCWLRPCWTRTGARGSGSRSCRFRTLRRPPGRRCSPVKKYFHWLWRSKFSNQTLSLCLNH